MKYDLSVEPMGAVRTTQRAGARAKGGMRYVRYKEDIGWQVKMQQYGANDLLATAIQIPCIVFRMPIPKSRKGKVQEGEAHIVKPDIDNLIKGLFDAVNGLVWVDDNRVAKIGSVEKVYSENPGIYFEVEEMGRN